MCKETNLSMESLQEQVNTLIKRVAALEKKSNINKIPVGLGIGDAFELAGLNWKILDITDKGYFCLADKLDEKRSFDDESNDWKESKLRHYLNYDFYKVISDEIGCENIIPFERDLLSLDGQTEYRNCIDKVSLLNIDEYRKYRNLIPNTDDCCCWLISPWSTCCNGDSRFTTVVSPSGNIGGNRCDNDNGVRPVCILKSNIFASKGK